MVNSFMETLESLLGVCTEWFKKKLSIIHAPPHVPSKALKTIRAPPTCTPFQELSYLSISASPEWILGLVKSGPCKHTVTAALCGQAKAKVRERGVESMTSFLLMANPHLC